MDVLSITSSVFLIIIMIAITALIISMVFMVKAIIKYYHLKGIHLKREEERADLQEYNRNKTVDYSNSLLEIIHMIIARIAVMRFRQFQDTHKIDPTVENGIKINKSHIVTLIRDIAKEAEGALNTENFHLEDTYFTREFYENYIISTTEILVKDMLSKIIDSIDEYL